MTTQVEQAGRDAAQAIERIFRAPRPALAPYPKEFYIVHKLFVGKGFPPCGVWGDIGDGPVEDWVDVLDAITENFGKHGSVTTTDTLRVWCVAAGEVEDWTETAINDLAVHIKEDEE